MCISTFITFSVITEYMMNENVVCNFFFKSMQSVALFFSPFTLFVNHRTSVAWANPAPEEEQQSKRLGAEDPDISYVIAEIYVR